jgi:transcriptional regulator with XRE-family HTH domain
MGLSQPQLAERANLSTQSVSNLENGKAKMSIESFIRILNVLQVSSDEILGLELPNRDKRVAELEELLFDCTPKEAEAILRMGRQLKETLRENK